MEPYVSWSPQYLAEGGDSAPWRLLKTYLETRSAAAMDELRRGASTGDSDYVYALATAHLLSELPHDAVRGLEALADSDPQRIPPRVDLASAYILIGNADRAHRELSRIVRIAPGDGVASQLKELTAWLEWRNKKLELTWRRVEMLAERTGQSHARDASQYLELARAYYWMCRIPGTGVDWGDVATVLAEARSIFPQDRNLLEMLVGVLMNAGDRHGMHEMLLALEQLAPDSAILEMAGDGRLAEPPDDPLADLEDVFEEAVSGGERLRRASGAAFELQNGPEQTYEPDLSRYRRVADRLDGRGILAC